MDVHIRACINSENMAYFVFPFLIFYMQVNFHKNKRKADFVKELTHPCDRIKAAFPKMTTFVFLIISLPLSKKVPTSRKHHVWPEGYSVKQRSRKLNSWARLASSGHHKTTTLKAEVRRGSGDHRAPASSLRREHVCHLPGMPDQVLLLIKHQRAWQLLVSSTASTVFTTQRKLSISMFVCCIWHLQ